MRHKHNILKSKITDEYMTYVTTDLFSSSSTDLKDEEEDVDDVDVERQSSVDVLLRADGQLPISNKKLGVVN